MSKLLINEPPLQVLPSLAKKIGLLDAIILQQIHFLCGISRNEKDGHYWVYNTIKNWHEEYFDFSSYRSVERALSALEKKGLLVSTAEYNKMAIDRTKWYRVDYDILYQLSIEIDASNPPEHIPSSRHIGGMTSRHIGGSNNQENTNKTTTDTYMSSSDEDAASEIKTKIKRNTKPKAPVTEIMNLYNKVLGDRLPNVREKSATREKVTSARWFEMLNSQHVNADKPRYTDEQSGLDWWESVFRKVTRNPHWMGENGGNWSATFDWIMKKENFIKVLEWRPPVTK